jgi:DNA polymerase-3 subunit gamma/tau
MSYQVLARKWRPRTFEEMVGQEHVLKTLIHALNTKRLHHAYLFTGTRGVGKTTVARILAKCLNCQSDITAHPCNQCASCKDIDAGRFVDLIEVDAASRTKVEDTRELLDNVQYAPTYGRFKIYLIDEVHMLSGHSFNALLKTLEEPPEHVKFLLATTDPKKLPATVLSRCLQFHLKNLNIPCITEYLQQLLTKENICFETAAVQLISKAANGSVRDALSLLDQAIAFSHENINSKNIHTLLGSIEQNRTEQILASIAAQDGKQLMDITAHLAEQGADFNYVLDDLISAFHEIAIKQVIPDYTVEEYDPMLISRFSQQFSKEDVQLYYQIALLGRRDLHLMNNLQKSFEMTLLRILAFQPRSSTETCELPTHTIQTQPTKNQSMSPILISDWSNLLKKLNLPGMVYTLASNCAFKNAHDNCITLTLSPNYSTLLNEKLQANLNEALNYFFSRTVKLIIDIDKNTNETPMEQTTRLINQQHQEAIKTIAEDPTVQTMIDKFGIVIDPELIKLDPYSEDERRRKLRTKDSN